MCQIDAKKLLEQIDVEASKKILSELEIDYKTETNEYFECRSVCHNSNTYKLRFYKDSLSFHCFRCSEHWSLYSFIMKIKRLPFYETLKWVCEVCGIEHDKTVRITPKAILDDWEASLSKFIKLENKEVELQIYDDSILNFFPKIYRREWLEEGISIESMEKYNIRWYPYRQQVIIPCYDENFNFIGARIRNFDPESNARYLPLEMLNGDSYKFPTNSVFYGIHLNKQAIIKNKKVVLLEGEKSVILTSGWYGDNNYSLALYGMHMSRERADYLISLGIEEVVIGIDHDYEEYGDENYDKYENQVFKIASYFKGFCTISVLCSHGGHKYKDAPVDRGKEFYETLYKNREKIVDYWE